MYGRQLAGVLIAVAIGPVILCGLILYIWRIVKRSKHGVGDTESPKPMSRMFCDDCRFDFVLPAPPAQFKIRLAHEQLWMMINTFALTCAKTVKSGAKTGKNPPQLSDSQLQDHLELLGGAKDRLPSHKLLELLPLRVRAFVSHIVSTAVLSAIALDQNADTTLLHAQLIAMFESMPPYPEDRNDGDDINGNVFFSSVCL